MAPFPQRGIGLDNSQADGKFKRALVIIAFTVAAWIKRYALTPGTGERRDWRTNEGKISSPSPKVLGACSAKKSKVKKA